MHTATAWGFAAVLFSLSLSAQDAGNGLQVKDGERGKELVAALTVAAKQAPTLSNDGNTATWQLDESTGLPKTFRLQRIDGRWYLVNR